MNAAHYIEDILLFYKTNGFDVTVFVDTKSIDRTRAIAAAVFEVVDMENEAFFIENVLGDISKQLGEAWVLRIDDDELPSRAMMNFIADWLAHPVSQDYDAVGFARHQCLVSTDGSLLAHRGHDAFCTHCQWRMYRPDAVSYIRSLHSPGFEQAGLRLFGAPPQACMIHLDWVVHPYAERRDKHARYTAMEPELGAQDRDYYLVEEAGVQAADLAPLDLPEFDETIRRLASRGRERGLTSWSLSLDG